MEGEACLQENIWRESVWPVYHCSAPICTVTFQNGTFLICCRRNSNECEFLYLEMVSLLGRSDQVS